MEPSLFERAEIAPPETETSPQDRQYSRWASTPGSRVLHYIQRWETGAIGVTACYHKLEDFAIGQHAADLPHCKTCAIAVGEYEGDA